MTKILFLPEQIIVPVELNKTILDICLENDILIGHKCGGAASCTSCIIEIDKGQFFLNAVSKEEIVQLSKANNISEKNRIACISYIDKEPDTDIIITIPEYKEPDDEGN